MKYFGIIVFFLGQFNAVAQFTLRGKIIASDTKTPLAGASIFLTSTSFGTVTNSAGEFTLGIPAGKYDLIASFVGYETSAQTISGTISEPIVISLKLKAEMFDEVVVGPYDKDGWKNWGQFFIENFVGTSAGAADCKIENYETLRFRHNKKENKLYAVAGEQLVISNKFLGYLVKYQMEEFEYDFKKGYLVYVGYPLFTPMEGGAARQRRWKKNRNEAYKGSVMNFMRSVFRNKIVEDGFEVRRMFKNPNLEKERVKALGGKRMLVIGSTPLPRKPSEDSSDYYRRVMQQPDELVSFSSYTITGDSIAYAIDSVTAGLEFNDYLHITYTKAPAPEKYRRLSPQNAQMRSELFCNGTGGVAIQSNGHYYPPLNILSLGFWAWSEKMADMLPFDFQPIK
ncbi:MAG: carboxypeptidase-like regulatory domain-containing protein [Chitinophagaceae bacterium]